MDSEAVNWFYIYTVVENFESLVLYFYTVMHHYAPWFRQAGFALIFSIGMFAVGIQMLKIPFDRMKGVGYTLGMIALAGLLNSPTTNTPAFAPVENRELTLGGYWSYHVGHQVTGVFRSMLTNSWNSNLREMGGAADGIISDSMDIAWSNNAESYADKFLQGNGSEAYLDYMVQCARPLEKALTTERELHLSKHVGLGSHMLGMSESEASDFGQSLLAASRPNDRSFFERLVGDFTVGSFWYSPSEGIAGQARRFHREKIEAQELLKTKLTEEKNPISGTTGYMIPSASTISANLSGEAASSTENPYEMVSNMGPAYAHMLPEGTVSVDPNSQTDNTFYPKSCYDLYLIADKTMSNFRTAVKGQKEFENLDHAKAYQSQFASMHVTEALHTQMQERLKLLEIDNELSKGDMRTLTDASADIFRGISEWINKHTVNYKIPALITAMALVSVMLVITFPLFATMSVIFGHRILVTYLKLAALPFIVVFINQFFIQISTNIIAFNNQHTMILNTFYPGTSEAASALSGQNIKAIIFSIMTVAELAVAKFLLFDDFRAVTSGNPGSVSTTAMGAGAAAAGAGAAIATSPARMAVTAKRLTRTSKGNSNQPGGNVASAVKHGGTLAAGSHPPVNYQYKPAQTNSSGLSSGPSGSQSSKRDLSGQKPQS